MKSTYIYAKTVKVFPLKCFAVYGMYLFIITDLSFCFSKDLSITSYVFDYVFPFELLTKI